MLYLQRRGTIRRLALLAKSQIIIELLASDPSKKRREWVHPCKCTLIAHQSCLMHLLSSRPTSRPKCPQCGYEYQVEKNLPLLVTSLLFRAGDGLFQAMGTSFIVTSAVGLGAFAVSGLFAVGTGYGALAVIEYFGAGYVKKCIQSLYRSLIIAGCSIFY